ncbi:MAG: polyphenol oxidase family protein [Synergistaceae bacterium]|nr:polyphenol oxidase family protein [Synergistaceae bacterium]
MKINTLEFISADFFMKNENPELDAMPLVTVSQVHGSDILVVDDKHYSFTERPKADGILLKTGRAAAALRFADCAPVMIWPKSDNHSDYRWVMILHSGYKGTVLNISGKGVELSGSKSKNLCAWVGPCIGFDDYMRDFSNDEWTQRGLQTFHEANYRISGGKVHFDLAGEIKAQLLEAGLSNENITLSGINTFRDNRCFSYRRGDVKERMTLYVTITESPS